MKELTIEKLADAPFAINEALNQLRVNLSFCGAHIKTVMVTSSMPNEGKSFLTFRLWKMIAELGTRVLYMDLDLRNSTTRMEFGLSCADEMTGVAHYLSGMCSIDEVLYRTNVRNGYVMPIGNYVSNPSLLLEGEAFTRLMDECKARFEYILVDTPPLGSVADALGISRFCDGTLLVIASGTPRKMVANSAQLLERAGCPLLGTVMNRAGSKGRRGYYNYGYYYNQYGYGEYGKKNK